MKTARLTLLALLACLLANATATRHPLPLQAQQCQRTAPRQTWASKAGKDMRQRVASAYRAATTPTQH